MDLSDAHNSGSDGSRDPENFSFAPNSDCQCLMLFSLRGMSPGLSSLCNKQVSGKTVPLGQTYPNSVFYNK